MISEGRANVHGHASLDQGRLGIKFLQQRFPTLRDHSITTALIVLAHAGPPDHFRTFYKSLGDLTKDKKDIDWLREFWDDGFRDRLQADPQKGSLLKGMADNQERIHKARH
jgi:hypothetical protein